MNPLLIAGRKYIFWRCLYFIFPFVFASSHCCHLKSSLYPCTLYLLGKSTRLQSGFRLFHLPLVFFPFWFYLPASWRLLGNPKTCVHYFVIFWLVLIKKILHYHCCFMDQYRCPCICLRSLEHSYKQFLKIWIHIRPLNSLCGFITQHPIQMPVF